MNNLHDKFVKERLLEKQNAIDFLKVAVPDDVLQLLNPEELIPTQNSSITEDIKELFSTKVTKTLWWDFRLAAIFLGVIISKSKTKNHSGLSYQFFFIT